MFFLGVLPLGGLWLVMGVLGCVVLGDAVVIAVTVVVVVAVVAAAAVIVVVIAAVNAGVVVVMIRGLGPALLMVEPISAARVVVLLGFLTFFLVNAGIVVVVDSAQSTTGGHAGWTKVGSSPRRLYNAANAICICLSASEKRQTEATFTSTNGACI